MTSNLEQAEHILEQSSLPRFSISDWHPHDATGEVQRDQPVIRWIDIDACDLDLSDHESRDRAAELLLPALNAHCGGMLELDMVIDVLEVADRREGEHYSEGGIRSVSSFRACAERQTEEIDGRRRGVGGLLVFEPVELLANERWLITCWHRPQLFEGSTQLREVPPARSHDVLTAAVSSRWQRGAGKTAGDLGASVLLELALTYVPAVREVRGWLEEWELQLYERDDSSRERLASDRERLQQLWGSMAQLREWVNPLNRPGLRVDVDKAWFCSISDHKEVTKVDDRLDKALRNLASLADVLRASFGVLHDQRQELGRERREYAQRRVEIIAAAFLVPTLVVGFYGANTQVPGEQTWWGFWVMVGVMFALTVVAIVALIVFRRPDAELRVPLMRRRAQQRADAEEQ